MTNEEILETNDSELIMLYREDDENAKNILYLKYKFIIDILIRKYSAWLNNLKIDYQEIYSESTVGFSDALKNYQDDKEASLPTFITLCVERRITGVIRKYSREKYKGLQETYSLDFFYDESQNRLMDIISDESINDPLKNIIDDEGCEELIAKIKSCLTVKENDVFVLMIRGFNYLEIAKILNNTSKQVDNTMQRIKSKIKKILNEKVN